MKNLFILGFFILTSFLFTGCNEGGKSKSKKDGDGSLSKSDDSLKAGHRRRVGTFQGGAQGGGLGANSSLSSNAQNPLSLPFLLIEHDNITHEFSFARQDYSFVSPVIIAGAFSRRGKQPGIPRFERIGTNSHKIRFQEWSYLDGIHIEEKITLLKIEEGLYSHINGNFQVGTFEYDYARGLWQDITLDNGMELEDGKLDIQLTAQTNYNQNAIYLKMQRISGSRHKFKVAIETEGNYRPDAGHEKIGFIAFSAPKARKARKAGKAGSPHLLENINSSINGKSYRFNRSILKTTGANKFTNEFSVEYLFREAITNNVPDDETFSVQTLEILENKTKKLSLFAQSAFFGKSFPVTYRLASSKSAKTIFPVPTQRTPFSDSYSRANVRVLDAAESFDFSAATKAGSANTSETEVVEPGTGVYSNTGANCISVKGGICYYLGGSKEMVAAPKTSTMPSLRFADNGHDKDFRYVGIDEPSFGILLGSQLNVSLCEIESDSTNAPGTDACSFLNIVERNGDWKKGLFKGVDGLIDTNNHLFRLSISPKEKEVGKTYHYYVKNNATNEVSNRLSIKITKETGIIKSRTDVSGRTKQSVNRDSDQSEQSAMLVVACVTAPAAGFCFKGFTKSGTIVFYFGPVKSMDETVVTFRVKNSTINSTINLKDEGFSMSDNHMVGFTDNNKLISDTFLSAPGTYIINITDRNSDRKGAVTITVRDK